MTTSGGATDAADLVLIGDADTVSAGIDRYREAGADEIALNLMGAPEQNDRTWELLGSLA